MHSYGVTTKEPTAGKYCAGVPAISQACCKMPGLCRISSPGTDTIPGAYLTANGPACSSLGPFRIGALAEQVLDCDWSEASAPRQCPARPTASLIHKQLVSQARIAHFLTHYIANRFASQALRHLLFSNHLTAKGCLSGAYSHIVCVGSPCSRINHLFYLGPLRAHSHSAPVHKVP